MEYNMDGTESMESKESADASSSVLCRRKAGVRECLCTLQRSLPVPSSPWDVFWNVSVLIWMFFSRITEYGHQAKFQPPVSRPVLEVAPNILLEPAQHLYLLPLHRIFVPVHISGVQGWLNFRWNWQWDQIFHRTFINMSRKFLQSFSGSRPWPVFADMSFKHGTRCGNIDHKVRLEEQKQQLHMTCLRSGKNFLARRLMVLWRRSLTSYMQKLYINGHNFYKVEN